MIFAVFTSSAYTTLNKMGPGSRTDKNDFQNGFEPTTYQSAGEQLLTDYTKPARLSVVVT